MLGWSAGLKSGGRQPGRAERPRSLTDKTKVSGTLAVGSIPAGGTE